MTPFVVALLVKLTLILAAGLVVGAISRGLSPSVRHLILYATLLIGALLPLAMWMSPSWNVPVLPRAFSTAPSSANDPGLASVLAANPIDVNDGQPSAHGVAIAAPSSAPTRTWLGVLPLLPLLWAIGFAAVITWLVIGHIGLRRIAARSWPLDGEDWTRILEQERAYA